MTEEQIDKQTEKEQLELNTSADKPSENKRRRLIKGAAAAIPVIMTLHSGAAAAMARTSNIMGAVGTSEAHTVEITAGQPQVVCVKGAADLGGGQYDLGEPPTAIAELEPYINASSNDESISLQGANCEGGGGIMVSATAWLSVGPKVGAGF